MPFPTTPLLDLGDFALRPHHVSDKEDMTRLANDPDIVRYMRDAFPHPYTEAAADFWLGFVKAEGFEGGREEEKETKDDNDRREEKDDRREEKKEKEDDRREETKKEKDLHLVMSLPDGRFAGNIGLRAVGPDATDRATREIGYWVGKPYWGRGWASRASRELTAWALSDAGTAYFGCRLERIHAQIHATNTASLKAAEKAGFVREGVMRRAAIKHGEVVDVVILSVVRE